MTPASSSRRAAVLTFALAGALTGFPFPAGAPPAGAPPPVAAPAGRDAAVAPMRPPVGEATTARPLRAFAAPPEPWAPGHRGVDLAAPVGAAVLAPAAGVVTFAGTVVDRGVVSVRHADGLLSSVEPVEASVAVGTAVAAGDVIGHVEDGPGHCGARPCVHWGVRRTGATVVYLDPWLLVPAAPIVLLPAVGTGPGGRPSDPP